MKGFWLNCILTCFVGLVILSGVARAQTLLFAPPHDPGCYGGSCTKDDNSDYCTGKCEHDAGVTCKCTTGNGGEGDDECPCKHKDTF